MITMSKEEFLTKLKKVCSPDTSADPDGWLTNNPLWGHCAVAAILAQDYFGGDIQKGSLKKHEKYAHLHSHFWNQLSDGEKIDFTSEQYSDLTIKELVPRQQTREHILGHADTSRRYLLLKQRFEAF